MPPFEKTNVGLNETVVVDPIARVPVLIFAVSVPVPAPVTFTEIDAGLVAKLSTALPLFLIVAVIVAGFEFEQLLPAGIVNAVGVTSIGGLLSMVNSSTAMLQYETP